MSLVFDKRVILEDFSISEKQENEEKRRFFGELITKKIIEDYLGFMKLTTFKGVIDKAKFYNLGVKFLEQSADICPFCGNELDKEQIDNIHSDHEKCEKEANVYKEIEKKRAQISEQLSNLGSKLEIFHEGIRSKSQKLLEFSKKENFDKLKEFFIGDDEAHIEIIRESLTAFEPLYSKLCSNYKQLVDSLQETEYSIKSLNVQKDVIESLGNNIVSYLSSVESYSGLLPLYSKPLADANIVLEKKLDELAGTEKITQLIELLDRKDDIQKLFQIRNILDSLSGLRARVSDYVSNKIREIVEEQLTEDVFEWYGKIKTIGDPDVHFSGFILPKTQRGSTVGQQIGVSAKSYGRELASAVSSLSESKLNALGLSIKISNNLKSSNPFDFLIIDDPVQSLDDEHSVQIITVLRELVENYQKQVILLSHNNQWLKEFRLGCSSLNGAFFEITGYTRDGPFITEASWKTWKARLKEVDAICKNPRSGQVRLQQAEEEIRLALCDITAILYNKVTGKNVSRDKLNAMRVKQLLLECGIPNNLIDKVTQTFQTTDDSHHISSTYSPNRQRIMQYHSWLHELGRYI
ncbi:MAG: hypothetical protein AMJ53_10395 [Gammaproteobacteria bacterium SG8_11]|nr:MAG: hypothetical protein AMJ53_10395 [Gammaproteobacteria bacterium SG8_11]